MDCSKNKNKNKKTPRNSVVTAPSLIVVGNRCGEIESRPTSCFLYVKFVTLLENWSSVNLMAYTQEFNLFEKFDQNNLGYFNCINYFSCIINPFGSRSS